MAPSIHSPVYAFAFDGAIELLTFCMFFVILLMAPSIHSIFFGLCSRWRHRSLGSMAPTDHCTIDIPNISPFFSSQWWRHQSIALIYAFVVDGTINPWHLFWPLQSMAPSIFRFYGTYRSLHHQHFLHFPCFSITSMAPSIHSPHLYLCSRWRHQTVDILHVFFYIMSMAPSIYSLYLCLCGWWRHRSLGSLAPTDHCAIDIFYISLAFSSR